jgi:hypothetical protein
MNANGVTSPAQGEISSERILLGRLALLSREGNHRAVAQMLADYFAREMPGVGPSATGIREHRRDSQSNPLYLALAELPLDLRIVNVLEQHFGALYVIDLERYRWPDDFLAIGGRLEAARAPPLPLPPPHAGARRGRQAAALTTAGAHGNVSTCRLWRDREREAVSLGCRWSCVSSARPWEGPS